MFRNAMPSVLAVVLLIVSPAAAAPRSLRSVRPTASQCLAPPALADAAASLRSRPVGQPERWWSPACEVISGSAGVTFSSDQGATLTPTCDPLQGVAYTYGLITQAQPNALLAVHDSVLIRSTDGGCSWSAVSEIEGAEFPPSLIEAGGARAYGWAQNRRLLFRVDGLKVSYLKAPVDAVLGVGVDRTDSAHLRLGGSDGSIWESLDAGLSWTFLGSAGSSAPLHYFVAFDPSDLDHVLFGAMTTGAYVTFDAGRTWSHSSGLTDSGSVNAFNGVISRVTGNVVWLAALDLQQNDAGDPSEGRHIFRSTDGGVSFTAVVDRSPEVTIVNGPFMAAHPTNPDVLYFIFGTYFQGYGTDVFRYDASTKLLTVGHNPANDINAIAFSPADPSIMYFGLEVEQIH